MGFQGVFYSRHILYAAFDFVNSIFTGWKYETRTYISEEVHVYNGAPCPFTS
jgi:hypothetical protein